MLFSRVQQLALGASALLVAFLLWGPNAALDLADGDSARFNYFDGKHAEDAGFDRFTGVGTGVFPTGDEEDGGGRDGDMDTMPIVEEAPAAPPAPGEELSGPTAIAYWNIYANGSLFADIVKDQAKILEASGVLARLSEVRYVTVGPDADEVPPLLKNPKFNRVKSLESGSELDTLSLIWEHCKANEDDRILYFHDKGSYDGRPKNIRLRKAMDCFVLNPGCLDALNEGYDTCGMRISPRPHLHYPGNYWWARCSHVRQLIDPMSFEVNQTFGDAYTHLLKNLGLPSCGDPFVGRGRYFAETWVGSLPDFKPADCIDKDLDISYCYNYMVPSATFAKVCPNYATGWTIQSTKNRKWGGVCTNASMLANAELFLGNPMAPQPDPPPNATKRKDSGMLRCSSIKMIRARSKLWYGRDADLMVRWRGLFGEHRGY